MTHFRFSPRPNRAHEIHWRDWNEDAFAQAVRDDKPILLDISGVWCHWCHVMDETSYSDPEIIQLINERFIAIRVETDQRPDVNRRYNLGGWPTTAFLTPVGDLLTGGTYIPPGQMRGYLAQVSDAYKNKKSEILSRIAEIGTQRDGAMSAPRASNSPLSPAIAENVLRAVRDNFDAPYGGFGNEPKFPHTEALELVLEKYSQTHDESLLPIVTITLTNMAIGGMYDHEAGGFFRYSTTRDWSVPHFEKMLEDHGKLLVLYAHAYQATRRETFLKTVETMLGYLQSTLSDSVRGGFYGSQDADEEYYKLSLAERAMQPTPFVDRTFYTDWNATMGAAFLEAAHLMQNEELQTFALKTLGRIWSEMFRDGVGIFHFQRENEPAQLLNQLTDLAHTALAFLDAYQFTGDGAHLSRAQTLVDLAMGKLFDQKHGGFFSEPRASNAPGLLKTPDKSLAENAAMARALIRLARLTENEKYRPAAEKTLVYFVDDYEKYSFTAADYARVVDEWLNEPLHIKIVGAASDAHTRELQNIALSQYSPAKLVQLFDPARDAARIAQLGFTANGGAHAYICVGTMCLAPVSETKALQDTLEQLHVRR